MDAQNVLGALVCIQVSPEFVETQMPPLLAAAANLAPSADEATDVQFVCGALVCVQVWANAAFAPHQKAEINSRCLNIFTCRL
jgi:hypothetical protein